MGELGLEKSTVVLYAHNPAWIELGRDECGVVRRLLAGLFTDVVHVGSTSVPGLEAKPILDIVAAVPDEAQIDEVVERLSDSGEYSYLGDKRDDGGLLFVRGSGDFRTVHVHVVGTSSAAWRSYLRFHDLLLTDASARRRYQDEKRLLAAQFPGDRDRYTQAKGAIIVDLLAERAASPPAH